MSPRKKTRSSKEETAAQVAQAIFTLALTKIRAEIEGISAGKIKPKKYTAVETIAFLAKQASVFFAEQRKADAAANRHLDQLTPAMVLSWLRKQDPTERQRIVREAQSMDARGSGLA